MRRIVFTGGGTAGHVTPNLALMERLPPADWDIHYIGTAEGIERELIAARPRVTYHAIEAGKLRRYASLKNLSDPFRVLRGLAQSKKLIRQLKPDVVFSKGGYVSVPVVMAARGRCPVLVHESDYSPGLANRIAARYADILCLTFTRESPPPGGGKPSRMAGGSGKARHGLRTVVTGTPIRPELYRGDRAAALAFAGLSGDKPVLLIMGGSQGAGPVNELVRAALPTLLQTFDIVHLCGKGKVDRDAVRPGYVQFAYVNRELADLLALCDVALSRAGANAVFELLALQKPTALVPLPLYASRGDQIQNARYMADRGWALHLPQEEQTPETLTAALRELYEQRRAYAIRMRDAKADGTEKILELIFEVGKGEVISNRE